MSNQIWSKTAPCLLVSLHDYNFRGSFTDFFISGSPKSPCQHLFTTNLDRSSLARSGEERHGQSTSLTLALTCQQCRGHIDLKIDFRETQLACPSQDFPLHHFCATSLSNASGNAYPRQYQFKCSYQYCQVTLWAVLRPAELQAQDIAYLVNVKPRMKAVLGRAPKTKERNPLEALEVFRTYIRDSLRNSERTIPTDNGAFDSCLGEGAAGMLARLGFVLVKEDNGKTAWRLPQPAAHNTNDATFDLSRCALEDVREELTALIQGRPETEKRGNIIEMYPPPPGSAMQDLERLLGASNHESLRPASSPNRRGDPDLYFGLGALPDFTDSLISWCYDRQNSVDPGRGPFYFRCLKEIANTRQSEELTTKALTLESQGVRTDKEITEALEIIGIKASHAGFLNDENILSQFRSRYQVSGQEEQRRMRYALGIIGEHRQSLTLRDAAKGTLETYDQALAFIGADNNTPDEFILALKTAKEQEIPADKETILKALEIIANARSSSVLYAHLQEAQQPAKKMDIQYAYNVFGASSTADSESLTLAFPGLLHDNPERREEIIQAMKVIAEKRGNQELLQQAQSAHQAPNTQNAAQATPLSDPRGLENIGNTCYLNSLLQYLFTVRPLRELVEDMEQHQQDLSKESLASKVVGDERVAKHQVLRAQSFVKELSELFDSLKTSRSGAVTLERSLAALTVAPTGDWTAEREQEKRRRSTMVSSKAPKLGISTKLVQEQVGSLHSPDDIAVSTESPREEATPFPAMDGLATSANGDVKMDDNMQGEGEVPEPANASGSQELHTSENVTASNGDEPSHEDENERPASLTNSERVGSTGSALRLREFQAADQSSSTHPPVLNQSEIQDSKQFKEASTEKIEEWARQQDMREALANVFRQLRWALKDEGDSNKGEQTDLVSRLFYGKENIVTLKGDGEKATETIAFHSLYVIPDESYENIYGMLDGAYGFRDIADEASQEQRSQYSTFGDLPPILHVDVAVTAWDKAAQHAVRRAPFKVAESFYMDRYLNDRESVETRKRVGELMSKLSVAKDMRNTLTRNELGVDLPSVLRNVASYLGEVSSHAHGIGLEENVIPETLIRSIQDLGEETSNQLTVLNQDIERASHEMSTLFPDNGNMLYQLHAVCMHTGRADSGHYFIYIYDWDESRWYKYNDETVERVQDMRPIFNPDGGVRDGIPAMLVYVRDGTIKELMQTVCRTAEEPSQGATQLDSTSTPETTSFDVPRREQI